MLPLVYACDSQLILLLIYSAIIYFQEISRQIARVGVGVLAVLAS